MPFKRQKSNVSPHYHDTRTLLRKYRDVIWNLEVSDLDLQEEFKAEYGLSTDALFVDSEGKQVGTAYIGAKDLDGWKAVADELLESLEA